MSLSKDDILNAIAEMSVMDVVELVSAMEEKFGVSAAAAVSAAPVAVAAAVPLKRKTSLTSSLPLLAKRKLTLLKLFVPSPALA